MTCSAFLFDFDLTLADSSEGILKCYREVFSRHGFSVSDEAILGTIGHTVAESFTLLTGVKEEATLDCWREEYRACADRWMNAGTVLYPETAAVLAALRARGARLAVISTKIRERIEDFAAARLPAGTFDVIVGGKDVRAAKPDPEGLLLVMKKLGVTADECFYTGDTVIDAEAARRAGVRFGAILRGLTPAAAFAPYPEARCMTTLNDLLTID